MKSKKILGIAALAAVTAVGGSFAYFQQTMVADNPFDTGTFNTTMQESFNPADGEDWQPGSKVYKEVKVVNTGNQPVIVRAKLDETWTRKVAEGEAVPDPFKEIKSEENDGNKIKVVRQDSPTDGQWELDDTVVEKTIDPLSKWVYGGDGWYYYIDVLGTEANDNETALFLSDVTLSKDVDLGEKETNYTYTAIKYSKNDDGSLKSETLTGDVDKQYVDEATGKVNLKGLSAELGLKKGDSLTTDIKIGSKKDSGYSNANYVLTITTQTVQATPDAVREAFGKEEDGTFVPWTIPSLLESSWEFTE